MGLGLGGLFGATALDGAVQARLEAASPINQVRRGLPPFLLVHGTADKTVPYEGSLAMREKLRTAGNRCDLITIPNGPHGMIFWDKIDPTYKEQVIAWLNRTLAASPPR